MKIAIIGAGAAGCFAAINIRRMAPDADITVLEGGKKPLAKVAITGGGRCNITNSFCGIKSINEAYPRGERLMKRLLKTFSHEDACRWFEAEGIRLVTQDDECVFPASQDAMEIVNLLTRLMRQAGIRLLTGHRVNAIKKEDRDGNEGLFCISFTNSNIASFHADTVLVATGGCAKTADYNMLHELTAGNAVAPVPSLFSLCLPGDSITSLMGTVVEHATAWLAGTRHRAEGALLITHWGMSGPAILKLSSYAARTLHENAYKAQLHINWLGGMDEGEATTMLAGIAIRNPKKQLSSVYPDVLNSRLWAHLLEKSGINPGLRWGEAGRKTINRITNTLINDAYAADGKNRFKEEFVTCGGVALGEINPRTMESRTAPGLFFAGEALDIDAITGGFNLQAAWTTGYVAATGIASRCRQAANKPE